MKARAIDRPWRRPRTFMSAPLYMPNHTGLLAPGFAGSGALRSRDAPAGPSAHEGVTRRDFHRAGGASPRCHSDCEGCAAVDLMNILRAARQDWIFCDAPS